MDYIRPEDVQDHTSAEGSQDFISLDTTGAVARSEAAAGIVADDLDDDIPVEEPGFGLSTPTGLELTTTNNGIPQLSKRHTDMINLRASRERGEATQTVGFSARVWAQVTLPYRDPGDQAFWVRKNGQITLRVEPASMTDASGKDYRGFPYGIIPRHIMTWMATEAFRTKSPELELGDTMNSFLNKLGLSRGQYSRTNAHEQMLRVFNSRLSVEGIAIGEEGQGHGFARRSFQVADDIQLWFSPKEEIVQNGLFESKVVLSDRFFQSIIEHPIPVDLDALRIIGAKPLTADIYIWLGYRLYGLSRPTKMRWEDLFHQFGSQTKRVRDFRAAFIKSLDAIKLIFPGIKYTTSVSFLTIFPGELPVRSTKPRKIITG